MCPLLFVVVLRRNVNSGTNTCFAGFDFIFVLAQFIDKREGILYANIGLFGFSGAVNVCFCLGLLFASANTKCEGCVFYSFRSKLTLFPQ